MSWFTDLFSGGANNIITSIASAADKFITTDEDKQRFQLQIRESVLKELAIVENTFQAEIGAKERIMVAEMQQGDNYTKRARPTIVYLGLVMIFFNYCIIPILKIVFNNPQFVPVEFPEEFWFAWGGVVGIYSIGRSVERTGVRNKVTGFATGSKLLNK